MTEAKNLIHKWHDLINNDDLIFSNDIIMNRNYDDDNNSRRNIFISNRNIVILTRISMVVRNRHNKSRRCRVKLNLMRGDILNEK